VLVYVSTPAPSLGKVLESVRSRFIAYGFAREEQSGSVFYKKPSITGFFKDLISSKAVIANAGFSLLTEALYLGKPYLAIPISHPHAECPTIRSRTNYRSLKPHLSLHRRLFML